MTTYKIAKHADFRAEVLLNNRTSPRNLINYENRYSDGKYHVFEFIENEWKDLGILNNNLGEFIYRRPTIETGKIW
jgi:hypothetical protein